MKTFVFLILLTFTLQVSGQQIDSVDLPDRVAYKYCDPQQLEKAKALLTKELSGSPDYSLENALVVFGPTLWSRYQKISSLNKIKGGDVTLLHNGGKLKGKMTQNSDGFRKMWDQLVSETRDGFKLRKPNHNEIDYYWSIISFEIEEPLLIAETTDRRFIINLSPATLKVNWVEEIPARVIN